MLLYWSAESFLKSNDETDPRAVQWTTPEKANHYEQPVLQEALFGKTRMKVKGVEVFIITFVQNCVVSKQFYVHDFM